MSAMSGLDIEVRQAISKIREIQTDRERWISEVTDEYGDLDEDECEEEDWYDTLAWYDDQLAAAGVALADLMEQILGDK